MSETDTNRNFPGLMRFLRISEYRKSKEHTDWCAFVLAGAEGLEPSARGFGVAKELCRCSPRCSRCVAVVAVFVCGGFADLMLCLMLCAVVADFDAPLQGCQKLTRINQRLAR